MRNPDKYLPEREEPDAPDSRPHMQPEEAAGSDRRGRALMGLVLVVVLVIGGLLLAHALHSMAQLQDCALSGRSNCS